FSTLYLTPISHNYHLTPFPTRRSSDLPIQVHVRVILLARPLAPRPDAGVDLLVQLADGAGADARAPQRLGDVLDAPHGDARQVHLHQRLLHRRLAPPVALDHLALEGGPAELG